MTRTVHLLRTGLLNYQSSLNLQKQIATRILKDAEKSFKNILILTEHPPVYTIGIRTKSYTINDEERLRRLGAEFHRTNRGGLITFHGPGQLVAYPIINLKHFSPSMKWFVCHVEKTVIDVCGKYGVKAERSQDTGVWVEDRKICAIGVHGSRYVTTHGLALNCSTDLSWFEHIVPCGIEGKEVTSLSNELKRTVVIQEVEPKFIESFERTFGAEIVELENDLKLELLENCR